MTSAPALRVELRASPSLLLALTLMAALALLALVLADLGTWLRGAGMVLILFAAGLAVRRQLRPPLRSFELDRDDARIWRGTEATPARLRGTRVFGPLLVLRLAWSEGPRPHAATLWLLPDSLEAEQHRQLRMRLSARTHIG
jgi:hypothetical protein